MAVRLSGMVSGLDTDSIVQELVSAYSTKKDSVVKKQTKLSWTQDAWKSMNTKIYSFYTGKLSAMRFSKNYSKKSTSISNSSVAKVTASSTAVNGTQSLKVKQLATSGYMTGGVIDKADGGKVSGSTKLSEVSGLENFTEGEVELSTGNKTTKIKLTSDMTVNGFVNQLKSAGVNASFDETNQRFFISATASGKDADFSLSGNDAAGNTVLSELGILAYTDNEKAKYKAYADMSDDDIASRTAADYANQKSAIETANKKLAEAITKSKDNYNFAQLKYGYMNIQYDKVEVPDTSAIDEKIANGEELTEDEQKLLDKASEAQAKNTESFNEAKAKMLAGAEGDVTSYTEELEKLRQTDTSNMTDEEIQAHDAKVKETEYKLEAANYAVAELGNAIYTLDDYDRINDSLKKTMDDETASIESDEKKISDNEAKIAEDSNGDSPLKTDIKNYYENLRTYAQGIVDGNGTTANSKKAAVRIEGVDSEIELNDAKFTNSTNTFQINGLTIQATAVTGDESVSITTDTDVDGMYDMIKDFFSSYNELIKSMDSAYNASSASGYEPLTDDEKEAMTDSEIEKWETKIKDSLLRRDSTLGGLSSGMKSIMSKAYTVNGKSVSLATYGIKTLGYFTSGDNEKGVYHIDGDEDDSSTSGNEDKLRAAIASDPDSVVEFFSKLTTELYTNLTNKMSASSLSSAYTVYNDKQMKTQYSQYTTDIKNWEEKISDYEEKYYKKFSSMEQALSKLNSQTSSLSGLLG